MQEAMLKGIVLGLTLAALVGPVFFALLQISLHRGYLAGMFLAIGIALSDAIYIFLTNFFLSYVKSLENVEYFLGIFGGFVLVIIGVMTMLKRPKPKDEDTEEDIGPDEEVLEENAKAEKGQLARKTLKSLGYVTRGFLLNFAHPGVLIFWLGVITLINSNWEYDDSQKILLYTSTIITVFLTDNLKAFLAHKISDFLTYKFLLWMNRIMGVVLIIFGMQLFFRTLFF